jgi:hypothetical protein
MVVVVCWPLFLVYSVGGVNHGERFEEETCSREKRERKWLCRAGVQDQKGKKKLSSEANIWYLKLDNIKNT